MVWCVVDIYFFFVPLHIFFCRQYILTVNFTVNTLKRSIFYCTTIFSH